MKNSSGSNKVYLGSYWNDHRRSEIEEMAVRYLLADVVLGHEHQVDLGRISSDQYVQAEVDSIFGIDLELYKLLMRKQLEATEKGLSPYKLIETAEGELPFRVITGKNLRIKHTRDSIAPKEASDYEGAEMQDTFGYRPFDAYMEWMIKRGTLRDVSHASNVFMALAQDSEVQQNYALFDIIHNLLFALEEPLMLRNQQRDDASRS